MDRGWIQFLLVVVPVLSLVGTWLALRGAGRGQTKNTKTRWTRDE